MPTTTVTKTEYTGDDDITRTQYSTTVPKDLAESFGLEGEKLEWEVKSANALTLRVVDDE